MLYEATKVMRYGALILSAGLRKGCVGKLFFICHKINAMY